MDPGRDRPSRRVSLRLQGFQGEMASFFSGASRRRVGPADLGPVRGAIADRTWRAPSGHRGWRDVRRPSSCRTAPLGDPRRRGVHAGASTRPDPLVGEGHSSLQPQRSPGPPRKARRFTHSASDSMALRDGGHGAREPRRLDHVGEEEMIGGMNDRSSGPSLLHNWTSMCGIIPVPRPRFEPSTNVPTRWPL